jgi:hypothetical protein
MWFDGEWIRTDRPKGKALYEYVRSLQPNIVINNRVGKGRKGMEGLAPQRGRCRRFRARAAGAAERSAASTETRPTMNDVGLLR